MPIVKNQAKPDLEKLKKAGLYRRLRSQKRMSGAEALIDGCRALVFAGNDYLGLASHPKVVEAAGRALSTYGLSAGASRLISGNHQLYDELESTLTAFKGKESALVFATGYMANIGTLTSLAGPDAVIFMDKLCHASLYDGARLSGAQVKRYPHNDLARLQSLLSERDGRHSFIVTDGVFSMDGDLADLGGLKALARRYQSMLLVDDAHGTGVLGKIGRGTADHLGVSLDMEIGTLSKALGGLGGYVTGPSWLIDTLVNRARSFIFTTGLPPATLAGALTAILVAREETWRQERVLALATRARSILNQNGLSVPEGITPIIPIVVGDEQVAVAASEACLKKGLFVPAIRTPAVPRGQARLRMTVSAVHSDAELERALDVLIDTAKEMGLI